MRFSTKYHLVERYDADILVIQEGVVFPGINHQYLVL